MSVGSWQLVAVVGAVAFALTLAFTPVSMRLARVLGAMDEPGGRHVHKQPTPRLGGVALFVGTMVPLVVVTAFAGEPSLGLGRGVSAIGLGASLVVVFLAGCVDDVRHLGPKAKLALQVVAACIAAVAGALVSDIRAYDGSVVLEMGWFAYPATVVYLVAFCNIVNLIDGLDGLAAGVVGIASAALIAVSATKGAVAPALLCACLLGSCAAFLRYNFHPAKTFMGDSGSLFLGFALGLASLIGTMKVSTVTAVAVPVIIAGVPVLDTLAAIIRRVRGHVSFDTPDAGHIHHSLLGRGLDQRHVVLTIYAVSALFAMSGFVIAGSGLEARVVAVVVDLAIAGALVWRLELFDPVLRRLYPEGRRPLFARAHEVVEEYSDGAQLTAIDGGAEAPEGDVDLSKRMNILVVSQYYWPEDFQIVGECEDLVARGHKVTVLTGLPNYPSGRIPEEYRHGENRRQEHNGVEIIRVPLLERGGNPLQLGLNYHSFSWFASNAVREMDGDYDVVYVPQTSPVTMVKPAALYKRLHDVPLLVYCLDLWPESLKVVIGNRLKFLVRHYGRVSRKLYGAADLVAVQSPSFMEYLSQTHGVLRERMALLPQFASTEYLDMDLSSSHDGINFLIAGNMGRAQDIPVILRAVELMKHREGFTVHFVGDGSCYEETRQYINTHGLSDRIVLHGRRPYEEMPEWYRIADACIIALNGDTWVGTTIPTRLQGYMAAGKPVVAAARGGIEEVVTSSGCGWAVSAGDSAMLAERLDAIVSEPSLLEGRGEAGRDYFRRFFTREMHMDVLEDMLLRLCGKDSE